MTDSFSNGSPRIAIVLPRGTFFSPAKATSIDLCVYDYVMNSKYRSSICVFAQDVEAPYQDVRYSAIQRGGKVSRSFIPALKEFKPEIIIVHQHVPSAVKLARAFPNIPVLLYKHGVYKERNNLLKRWRDGRQFRKFAGIIWVSQFAREGFVSAFPALADRSHVVWNGINPDSFKPLDLKRKTLLYVGRASPEKGALEAVRAMQLAVAQRPDWHGRLILSTFDHQEAYVQALRDVALESQGRISLLFDRPFAEVTTEIEKSTIMVVPSLCFEAFGRTAIEAFAGGAALISSTRGGLNEVVGDAAFRLNDITADDISEAMLYLMDNPQERLRLTSKGLGRLQEYFTIEKNAANTDRIIYSFINST